MNHFRIRTVSGGAGGVILGGAHLLFEIEEISKGGSHVSRYFTFTGLGATIGIKAGAYGPSEWTDFDAECGHYDFEGYAVLASAQGGPYGAMKLSFVSGRASGTEIIGSGWGFSTDASISFLHGWMRLSL